MNATFSSPAALLCLLMATLVPVNAFAAPPSLSGTTIYWSASNTVSSVKTTTAKLGATIANDGGQAITERGIVWSTTDTTPTIGEPGVNKVIGAGTGLGDYFLNLSGLTMGAHIYFSGYASNAGGTGYSAPANFWSEPSTAAAPTVNTPSGTNYFSLTVNYVKPADADGVLVVARQSYAPAKAPYDGTTYAADAQFGLGNPTVPGCRLYCEHVVADAASSGSVTVTGLKSGTPHYFAVYAYKGSGTGISGINYVQTIASTGPVTTDTVPPEGKSHNEQYVAHGPGGTETPADCTTCHNHHQTSQPLIPTALDMYNKCFTCHQPGGAADPKIDIGLHPGDGSVDCGFCHSLHSFRTEELYSKNHAGVYGFNKSFVRANMSKRMNPADYPPPSGGGTTTALDNTVFQNRATDFAFASTDPDPDTGKFNGVCQTCHTNPAVNHHTQTTTDNHRIGSDCMTCHKHTSKFIHGLGGSGCTTCHGHEDGYLGAPAGTYHGSTQSHATHTESDDDPIGPRPILTCDKCHDTNNFPYFKSGTDLDSNGVIDLKETDVCDTCHSAGGPFDGLNDPDIGAKYGNSGTMGYNWRNAIYTADDSALKAGNEKWCVTCHDSGTSSIGSGTRPQAPDVTRTNTASGYYVSGHGAFGKECVDCHGLNMAHIDSEKTYKASSNNYQAGYRLADIPFSIWGPVPMKIPNPNGFGLGCNYSPGDSQLCFKCHDQHKLMDNPKGTGTWCANPNVGPIQTGFRNESIQGLNFHGAADIPANIHWDHIVDIHSIFSAQLWDSDRDGTADSKATCITCHNPHGAAFADNTATKRMTRLNLQIEWGTDPTYGDYGAIGASANQNAVCAIVCHGNGVRYYRTGTVPILTSIQAEDSNNADPTPAEAGFTNNRTVRVTFTVSGTAPAEMRLAEDAAFTQNVVDWTPYASPYNYTLSSGDGSKTIYARLRTGTDLSDVKSTTIVLDTAAPATTSSTLTAPLGGETWIQQSSHAITWSGISDTNLKALPIALFYSTNGGATFPATIASGEANDGTYSWTVPVLESTQAQVRVLATDRAGNQGFDDSNNFTIAAITPVLSGITLTDSNSADPAPAEAGYTNNQSVTVTLTASNNPTLMQISEDPTFTAVPWIPFAATSSFSLSGGEGSKTVYCKIQNGAGESGVQNATILYDQTAPNVPLLTAPNGGELWTRNTSQSITWNSGSVTDPAPGVLKASPIILAYSTDNFATATAIGAAMANSGSFAWLTPSTARTDVKVRLTATDRAGNRSSDDSDNAFFISPPSNYIVINTNDIGAGSLRQALTDLISAGGNDALWFNIPNTDPGFINGVAVITISSGALPVLSQPGITIDGGSQTAIRGNTNPNGPEVRLKGSYSWYALDITAANATINGLQVTNWATALRTVAASTTLTGSHVGFSSDTTGYDGVNQRNYAHIKIDSGATNARLGLAGKGNYLSCSWIDTAVSNAGTGSIIDSNVLGILPNGAACANSGGFGIISLSTSAATVRNNVLCGGGTGIYLAINGNIIQGNTFGTWYNGASWQDCADQSDAIRNQSGSNHLIGGPNVATDDAHLNDSNVIDPGTYGINFFSSGNNTSIYGNFIGTNPQKTTAFPGTYGIYTSGQSSIKIGGGGAGESGNVITNLTGNGVYLSSASDNLIKISRNSFSGNGSSTAGSDDGIYLVAGANGSIARPSITGATTSTVTVGGVASGDTVEVFVSDYDGAGTEYGEGRTFIGSAVASTTSVNVDISGASVSSGTWLTATRTTSAGSTSAFSANLQVP